MSIERSHSTQIQQPKLEDTWNEKWFLLPDKYFREDIDIHLNDLSYLSSPFEENAIEHEEIERNELQNWSEDHESKYSCYNLQNNISLFEEKVSSWDSN